MPAPSPSGKTIPHLPPHVFRPNVLWLTPQDLAAIRLEYEIGEMVSGHRPAYPLTRRGRRAARCKVRHPASDS